MSTSRPRTGSCSRVALLIGLGFIAVIPPLSQLTQRSQAEELGILFCLMTIASPPGAAVLFHVAVLPDHCLDASCCVRSEVWDALGDMGFAGGRRRADAAVAPRISEALLQAIGNNLAATRADRCWIDLAHAPSTRRGAGRYVIGRSRRKIRLRFCEWAFFFVFHAGCSTQFR